MNKISFPKNVLAGIKNKICLVLLAALCLTICSSCSLDKKIASKVFAQEVKINTMKDLYTLVEQGLAQGKTEISFSTTDLKQEDLDGLNEGLSGYYGTVDSYSISSFGFLNTSSVKLHCEISDNYYVERAFLQGEEIPEGRKKAARLYKVVKKLLSKIKGKKMSAYRREKRIHDLLVYNVVYDMEDEAVSKGKKATASNKKEDPDIYTSYGALVEKKAVCNGYAQAMKLLCDLSGVECKVIVGTADRQNHAWNLVKLGDSWYHVDVTWDDPVPDDKDRIFYHYFNVNDDFISKDHKWKKENYPVADKEDYNFFVLGDLLCEDYQEFQDKCEEIYEKDDPHMFQIQVKDFSKKKYSEENMRFLFRLSGADGMNIQYAGKAPRVTLLFTMTND